MFIEDKISWLGDRVRHTRRAPTFRSWHVVDIFKKISQIITPPIRKKSTQEARQTLKQEFHTPTSSPFDSLVRKILIADSVEDPEARQGFLQLKQIAVRNGVYATASKLKSFVMNLPERDETGTPYNKQWGYQLAAELYLKHLRAELDMLNGRVRPLGPTVFGGYLDDYIQCLFEADKVSKAIETVLAMADKLLSKGVHSSQYRERYTKLAEQAVTSITTLSIEKREKDKTNYYKAVKIHRKAKTPVPTSLDEMLSIDSSRLDYLKGLQQNFVLISKILQELGTGQNVSPHLTTADSDRANILNQVQLLQSSISVAEKIGYSSFSAILLEKVGRLRVALRDERSGRYLREAAKHYEMQGDIERRLRLTNLSKQRYQKAVRLYESTNSMEDLARVRKKISWANAPQ